MRMQVWQPLHPNLCPIPLNPLPLTLDPCPLPLPHSSTLTHHPSAPNLSNPPLTPHPSLTPHPAPLTSNLEAPRHLPADPSPLAPCSSPLTPHLSSFTCYPSPLAPHVSPRTSHPISLTFHLHPLTLPVACGLSPLSLIPHSRV